MKNIRKLVREIISELEKEEDLNERGLAFNEKTLTPRSDGDDLPYHAPVTTNKPQRNRKGRFK